MLRHIRLRQFDADGEDTNSKNYSREFESDDIRDFI